MICIQEECTNQGGLKWLMRYTSARSPAAERSDSRVCRLIDAAPPGSAQVKVSNRTFSSWAELNWTERNWTECLRDTVIIMHPATAWAKELSERAVSGEFRINGAYFCQWWWYINYIFIKYAGAPFPIWNTGSNPFDIWFDMSKKYIYTEYQRENTFIVLSAHRWRKN